MRPSHRPPRHVSIPRPGRDPTAATLRTRRDHMVSAPKCRPHHAQVAAGSRDAPSATTRRPRRQTTSQPRPDHANEAATSLGHIVGAGLTSPWKSGSSRGQRRDLPSLALAHPSCRVLLVQTPRHALRHAHRHVRRHAQRRGSLHGLLDPCQQLAPQCLW